MMGPIAQPDNPAIAKIIRQCLEEFGANKPGTVYYDATTDALYELFTENPLSAYFIARINDKIIGGGGIFPSAALPEDTCELVKMYLLPEARGTGIGAALINLCMDTARSKGFKKMYIETMPELKRAISVYEKFGFEYLEGPLGNTGHFGCGVWMLKSL
ncbi:MAG: GNAT family N-acetyltransferase [Chitinophagia bacterium]|nr:GNAT family N-acetyltransferase [Chitinophagia bacterium]